MANRASQGPRHAGWKQCTGHGILKEMLHCSPNNWLCSAQPRPANVPCLTACLHGMVLGVLYRIVAGVLKCNHAVNKLPS